MRRYILKFFLSYAAKHMNPFIISTVLTKRLVAAKESESLMFFSVLSTLSAIVSTVITQVLIVASIYVFVKYGTTLGYIQVVMVTVTLVAAHLCCKDLMSVAGIYRVLLQDAHRDVKSKLKDILKYPEMVLYATKYLSADNADEKKSEPPPSDQKTEPKP